MASQKTVGEAMCADTIRLDTKEVLLKKRSQEDVSVQRCSKTIVMQTKPVITRDKKYILCGSGPDILVLHYSTGECCRIFTGHRTVVSDIFLTHCPYQVLSASNAGILILWDYRDCTRVQKISLAYVRIRKTLFSPSNSGYAYVVRDRRKKNKVEAWLSKISLKATKDEVRGEDTCMASVIKEANALDSQGLHFATTISQGGNSFVSIFNLKRKKVANRIHYKNQSKVCCLLFHPSEATLAVADMRGRIELWRNVFQAEGPVIQELHWHSHRVGDMVFANNGENLFSVGEESVLVNWQLNSQDKQFVSKLGGDIKFVNCWEDDSEVVVTLANNKLKIISTMNNKAINVIHGLAPASNSGVGLIRDPRSDFLALSSSPSGTVQVYDPGKDSLVQQVDIAGENYLPLSHARNRVYNTEVDHVTFTWDGTWLVTVENSNFPALPFEIRMKFWRYNINTLSYDVKAVIEPPHSGRVVSLTGRPKTDVSTLQDLVVSASVDGTFKLWTLLNLNGKGKKSWNCLQRYQYSNLLPSQTLFSADGSLLGVTFDDIITLWDPDTGIHRTSLSSPVKGDNIKHIAFGYNESSHYLIAATNFYVCAWDLLSCSQIWYLKTDVEFLVADSFSRYIALFAKDGPLITQVFILDPSTPTPEAVLRVFKKRRRVISAAFCSPVTNSDLDKESIWNRLGKLYILSHKKDLFTVGPATRKITQVEISKAEEEIKDQADFVKIFGFRKSNDPGKMSMMESVDTVPSMAKVVKKVMATPSHVMPSIESLGDMLFQAALPMENENKGIRHSYQDIVNETEDETTQMDVDCDDQAVNSRDTTESSLQENHEQDTGVMNKPRQHTVRNFTFDVTWLQNVYQQEDNSDS